MTALALILATSLGLGFIPFAPGTFGSAAGLLVWAFVSASVTAQVVAIAATFLMGWWSATRAETYFGRTDPGQVVIDEVMGMLITLFGMSVGWKGALGGFLLFRVADILKPYPANRFERLPGGLGVMADDAMAAVYANLVLRACIWMVHRLL